jgi:hypothetical protein
LRKEAMRRLVERTIGSFKSPDPGREELERTKRELEIARDENEQLRRQLKMARNALRRTTRDYLLCKVPKASVCAEIGVHEGMFSQQILDAVEPERLHLIDPWTHEEEERYQNSRYGGLGSEGQKVMDERFRKVEERFADEIRAGRVQIHREFSNVVCEEFQDGYFDWIYIDGNHLYEFVKQDLEMYYPKIKPGGFMTGDDYGSQGWWNNGVQKAVDEFVSQRPNLTLEVKGKQFIIEKGT